MTETSVSEAKALLRKKIQSSRLLNESHDTAGLTERLIELVSAEKVKRLACYLTFPGEPDTRGFVSWCLENHIEVVMPRSNRDGSLDWVYFRGVTEPGIFGYQEPVGSQAMIGSAELILLPALAVDGSGNRLGKGLGYYDRALSLDAQKYAVVFDDEVLDYVPHERHDVRMNGCVTPTRILRLDH